MEAMKLGLDIVIGASKVFAIAVEALLGVEKYNGPNLGLAPGHKLCHCWGWERGYVLRD